MNNEIGNLVLTRKLGQKLYIGDDIVITINEVGGDGYQRGKNTVVLGINAPKGLKILREEAKNKAPKKA